MDQGVIGRKLALSPSGLCKLFRAVAVQLLCSCCAVAVQLLCSCRHLRLTERFEVDMKREAIGF